MTKHRKLAAIGIVSILLSTVCGVIYYHDNEIILKIIVFVPLLLLGLAIAAAPVYLHIKHLQDVRAGKMTALNPAGHLQLWSMLLFFLGTGIASLSISGLQNPHFYASPKKSPHSTADQSKVIPNSTN
jgi:hypothetical protein